MTKFFKSNKKDIKSIPFHILAEARNSIFRDNADPDEQWNTYLKSKEGFLSQHRILDNSAEWIYPQILALLAKHTLPLTDEGQVDCSIYWKVNLDSKDMWDVGLFRFLMIYPRGLTVSLQSKQPGIQFSALVPIVLAAHKQYNNTPYGMWDRDTIDKVVPFDLASAMQYTEYDYTTEDLVEIRNEGLMTKSGATVGQLKNILSTWRLTGIPDPNWRKIPALAQAMLTQIWVANPALRTKYMVLDPKDWDAVPAPLVEANVIASEPKPQKVASDDDPW